MIRLEMSLEDGAKLSSSTQTSRETCVFECVYEGMPPNGSFDNANTWCLNMIMFINFQPRDLRGVVFFWQTVFEKKKKKKLLISINSQIEWGLSLKMSITHMFLGFHKWGYPNSWIVSNVFFGYKWMIWWYSYFRTPPNEWVVFKTLVGWWVWEVLLLNISGIIINW